MIINPITKTYEVQSHRPNICWQEGWLLIDETKEENKEMIQLIINHVPYVDLTHKDGIVTSVTVNESEKKEELHLPTETERVEALEQAMMEMMLGGM